MINALLFAILSVAVLAVILQILLLLRKVNVDLAPLQQTMASVEKSYERLERSVREEIARNREEAGTTSRQSREELSLALKSVGDSLNQQLLASMLGSEQKLEKMRETVEQRLTAMQEDNAKRLDQIQSQSTSAAQKMREEVTLALNGFGELTTRGLTEMGSSQRTQMGNVVEQLTRLTEAMERKLETQKTTIDLRLTAIQTDHASSSKAGRDELNMSLKNFNDSVLNTMTGLSDAQKKEMEAFTVQLGTLTQTNQQQLESLKSAVELKLASIQEDNGKQLDQMRATVDEKLQGTLEKRLGESFKLVCERMDVISRGLGEMQSLAHGVGDLKKVLTNVKSRGTWGEVQLGSMLEQVLTPEQYATNISTKNNNDRVEYAIRFPGREDKDQPVWLPIDAKFPMEDYQRLVEAQEKGDAEAAEAAAKQLENRIKGCAQDICNKYINPPTTTDIGILFLPTEGLFAEVVRRIGLVESIHQNAHVLIAGPTTLYSLLNSFQMGFRTLTIEKRSSEVWSLLSAVKTEFLKYNEVLSRVQTKLQNVSETIDKEVATRARAINRKLRDVQELPVAGANEVLMLEASVAEAADAPEAEEEAK